MHTHIFIPDSSKYIYYLACDVCIMEYESCWLVKNANAFANNPRLLIMRGQRRAMNQQPANEFPADQIRACESESPRLPPVFSFIALAPAPAHSGRG